MSKAKFNDLTIIALIVLALTVSYILFAVGLARHSPPTVTLDYPTYGARFSTPDGFTEVPTDNWKRITQFVKNDQSGKQQNSLIFVEVGRAVGTLDETANGLAETFNGRVTGTTTLDGATARKVLARNDKDSLEPVVGIVAYHEGLTYLIMGGARSGYSPESTVETIRSSWKWREIEPPVKHLEFRDQPIIAFNGTLLINIPKLMHSYPQEKPNESLDFGLRNLQRGQSDLFFDGNLIPKSRSFPELAQLFINGIQLKMKYSEVPKWREFHGTPHRMVTQCLYSDVAGKNFGQKWAMIDVDDEHMALLHFSITVENIEDRKAYDAAVEKIIDSVRLLKK